MSDHELLEAAARAAGLIVHDGWWGPYLHNPSDTGACRKWNPLTDDGDALRLAVRCAQLYGWKTFIKRWMIAMMNQPGKLNDHCFATRRAIVRAAAAMDGGSVREAVAEDRWARAQGEEYGSY